MPAAFQLRAFPDAADCCGAAAASCPLWRATRDAASSSVAPDGSGSCFPGRSRYNATRLSRSALLTTLTDDSAIAAAAMIGESRMPNSG